MLEHGIRRAAIAALLCAATLYGAPALAQDVTAAANAYSKAQKAEVAGRHDEAAELYELADSIAPTPEALRSALRARLAAGQLSTAAGHAETLLARYPDDAESKKLATDTLDKAGKKLARLEAHCSPRECSLAVDGAAASPDPKTDHVIWIEAGSHEVVAVFGSSRAEPRSFEAKVGDRQQLAFEAPPEKARVAPTAKPSEAGTDAAAGPVDRGVAPKASRGLSPTYFIVGAVVTVGLGAASTWSGLDVLSAHDDYEKKPTESAYQDGLDRQRRTNVLLGATGVFALSTVIVGVFTDWSGGPEGSAALRVAPTADGRGVQLHGRF